VSTGDNPNSRKNLRPVNTLSREEAKAISSLGGKAVGKLKRERKTIRETLLALLETGNTQNNITAALIEKALSGDTKAFEVVRDTAGEKPTDKVETKSNISARIVITNDLDEIIDVMLNKNKKDV
jgi:hypothetical protein